MADTTSDARLLDAYSATVAGVVETIGPAVCKIAVAGRGRRGGTGSAVVLSPDGLIVTNQHVVGHGREARVRFLDGRTSAARLIGGALTSSAGAVIGVTTPAIRGAQGISFAIAASTVALVVAQLIRFGTVRRARLGIALATIPLPARVAAAAGLAQRTAVVVQSVARASPAERAGLRSGDILLTLDGAP